MPKGRGVILMGLEGQDSLKLVGVFADALSLKGVRRGRAVEEAPQFDVAKRARMGKPVNMKVSRQTCAQGCEPVNMKVVNTEIRSRISQCSNPEIRIDCLNWRVYMNRAIL